MLRDHPSSARSLDDHGHVPVLLPQPRQDLHPVHARHPHMQQHGVHGGLGQPSERIVSAGCRARPVADSTQGQRHTLRHRRVIVHDQYPLLPFSR